MPVVNDAAGGERSVKGQDLAKSVLRFVEVGPQVRRTINGYLLDGSIHCREFTYPLRAGLPDNTIARRRGQGAEV